MSIQTVALALIDNGGRRFGSDRRKFSYTAHIPNKRTIEDRRSGIDRRNGSNRRSGQIISKKIQRADNDLREGIDRRSGLERIYLMGKNSLKRIRESILIGKAELARKADISLGTLSRIEQGLPCRMETQRKVIKALGYKLSDRDKIFPEN